MVVCILTFVRIMNTPSESLKSIKFLFFNILVVEISCSAEMSLKKVLLPLGLVEDSIDSFSRIVAHMKHVGIQRG